MRNSNQASKISPRYVMIAIAVLVILGLILVTIFVTMGGTPPESVVPGDLLPASATPLS